MASIMSKAVVGSVIALIFYILSFMPYMFVFTSGMNSSFWPILVTVSSNLMIFFLKSCINKDTFLSMWSFFQNLLMTSCFSFGFNYVTSYEQQAVGLNWDNIFESPIEGDQFNFAYTCVMILFDAALYSVIAIVVILGKSLNY